MKRFHFITGLPRSGSTLLSTILNQNPRFTAGISSPLQSFAQSIITEVGTQRGLDMVADRQTRCKVIRNIAATLYDGPEEVVFDTNRLWSLRSSLISNVFGPRSKFIVCVRDISDILNSYEHLFQKQPLDVSVMYPSDRTETVFSRCDYLMDMNGPVGKPFVAIKELMANLDPRQYMFVEYDLLIANPQKIIEQIYKFIDEELYTHTFDNLHADYSKIDAAIGVEGLHDVRQKVERSTKKYILPQDVAQVYNKLETVWRGINVAI